jgi:hypothetical protein
MIVAQASIPQTHLGVGTGVIRYLSQLGLTLGAVLMGLLVNGALAGNTGAGLPTTATARLQLSGVLQNGFGVVLVLSALALLTTFFLKDIQRHAPGEGNDRAGEPGRAVNFPVKRSQEVEEEALETWHGKSSQDGFSL